MMSIANVVGVGSLSFRDLLHEAPHMLRLVPNGMCSGQVGSFCNAVLEAAREFLKAIADMRFSNELDLSVNFAVRCKYTYWVFIV